MHFTEDRNRYKIIEDIPAASDEKGSAIPQRRVLYLAERKPRICNDRKDGCGGALESKDNIPLRRIYDDIDGVFTCIIVYKKRFICQNCKKVYTVGSPAELDQGRKASFATTKMLIDPTVTMKSLAKQGGFSEATGSHKLKTLVELLDGKATNWTGMQQKIDLVNKIREGIKTYHLEANLFYIPFLFRNQWRCLICTCDLMQDDSYLLDILEVNELAPIAAFNNRLEDKKTVRKVFCNADNSVIAFMEQDFPGAVILIARACMRDALGLFYRKKRAQQVNISQRAYQKILPIIRNKTIATWKDSWLQWRADLDEEQLDVFAQVNRFVEANEDMIGASFKYSFKASFMALLKEIKLMHNNSFDVMRMRMLFANRSHFDKCYEKDLLGVFSHISTPLPQISINNFGVNISDLLAELKEEREISIIE